VQGQTFNEVGVYLPDPVFSHGKLYVALSRGLLFCFFFILEEKRKFGTLNSRLLTGLHHPSGNLLAHSIQP